MFRQIWVDERDQPFQRILWRTSSNQPLEMYQLKTVTYGTSCAPYLAMRTLRQLAYDESASYPEAAKVIQEETYVDDILSGGTTLEEALNLRNQVQNLLKTGGFSTHKWAANHPDLLKNLSPETETISTVSTPSENPELRRMLGLQWNSAQDCFVFSLKLDNLPSSVTKRVVLAKVAQIFDPLGLIAPITVLLKSFFQSLWLLGLEWDQNLPESYLNRWKVLYNSLNNISSISIPRWLGTGCSESVYEIHAFADASEMAYAGVVYLKNRALTGPISLVAAKTRVAPLKKVTLPRLELCAAQLTAQLVQQVLKILPGSPVIYLWSDSLVTLYWVRNHPSRWTTYVANRVANIQTLLPEAHWSYVPSEQNPADCASRGMSAEKLEKHRLWWEGPSWLSQPKEFWPKQNFEVPKDVNKEAVKRKAFVIHAQKMTDPNLELLLKFSSLDRLIRISAWCFRFYSSCKNPLNLRPSYLTSDELKRSLLTWVKLVQSIHFPEEIKLLKKGAVLPKSSLLINLDPFIDSEGILRVGGRLSRSLLSDNKKHPYVIPQSSHLTNLIIRHSHCATLHGGLALTMSHIRQKFWIIRGRVVVKSYIRNCTTCIRYTRGVLNQKMSDLPSHRVVPSRPFTHIGLDYAGPILVTPLKGRGQKSHKAFIALFICLSTKAVHIELVSDYSSVAFLAAFRRFVSRRGLCASILSDNGTNFVGAQRELKTLLNQATKQGSSIFSELSNQGVSWKFIPPYAPHFGGLWEAAIKSAKAHLKRIIGNTILSFEEMTTLLSQIEAIMNSRPLIPISEDKDCIEVLTPGHFLIGGPLLAIPEPSLDHLKLSTLSRWQLVQQLKYSFWKKWNCDYLNTLQTRNKWHDTKNNLQEGSIVLIKGENTLPSTWPLGRVLEVHKGADGLVRVARIKTANSIVERPIAKLILLLEEESNNN